MLRRRANEQKVLCFIQLRQPEGILFDDLDGGFTRSRLNKVISEQVKQGNFELEDNKKPTISDIKQFCYASDLNNALTYAYIEEVEINEEL